MVEINYNKELDILTVEEQDYEEFERSLELGGFVLDLDQEDKFLGLEIIDASQKTPLDPSELERISDVEVNLEKNEDFIRIEIVLSIDSMKSVISSQYPVSASA